MELMKDINYVFTVVCCIMNYTVIYINENNCILSDIQVRLANIMILIVYILASISFY